MNLVNEPKLCLYGLAQFFSILAAYIPVAFLPQFMMQERGIPHTDAGNVIAFHGIGFIFGGIICGSIIHRLKGKSIILSGCCTFVLCGLSFALICSYEYWQFSLLMLSSGGFWCGMLALRSLVLIDLCGQELIKDGNSLLMFCGWLATLFGAPLAGFFKTEVGTLIYSFLFAAISYLIAGCCYIVIICT